MAELAGRTGWRLAVGQAARASLVALSVLASACGGSGSEAPPVPPSISLSAASIEAAAQGENISVDVSNGGGGALSWTAALAEGVDWARISSGSSGSNAGTIEIEVAPNLGDMREVELTVSAAGAASGTVTVRQADGRPAIELEAPSAELDGEGGSVTLAVRNTGVAPMQWSAALPDGVDWAYIASGREGVDAGEIMIRYRLNSGFDRELPLRVTAAAAVNSPQSLTLSQDWFASSACTFPEARGGLLEQMKRWYYFNDEPEQQARYDGLDIDEYLSLDELLTELRAIPRDLLFSQWITRAQAEAALDRRLVDFGFYGWTALRIDFNTGRQELLHYQVADVYAGSPADTAGLERGDKILGLNGKRIADIAFAEHVIDELGPSDEGFEVSFDIEKPSGARRSFSMAKAQLDVPAVPEEHARIFDTGAGQVGYLHVRGFWGDAQARLLEEFAELNAAGIKNLIVDIRYAALGFTQPAEGLATLIGGPELYANQTRTVLSRRVHNEQLRREGRDSTVWFGCGAFPAPDMAARCENESSISDLENVVFITSFLTIGPGELAIAALQPHENVALVGTRTLGKPVGRYALPFCLADPNDMDSRQAELLPVAFANFNSEGFGDYYAGLQPTQGCEVLDEGLSLQFGEGRGSRPFGDPDEPRIAAALRYLETGSCGVPALSSAPPYGMAVQLGPGRSLITLLPDQ